MTPFVEALYTHALEHRVDQYLQSEEKERADTQHMVDHALARLKELGPQGEDCRQRIECGFMALSGMDREACFQAGLSIGLELARL